MPGIKSRAFRGYGPRGRISSIDRGDLEKQCLHRYVTNVVEKLELSEELLALILSLLTRCAIKELLEWFPGNQHVQQGLTCNLSVDSLARKVMNYIETDDQHDISAFEKAVHSTVKKYLKPLPGNHLTRCDSKLFDLVDVMKLTYQEIDTICFTYCYERDLLFRNFCQAPPYETMGFYALASLAMNLSIPEIRSATGPKGRLATYGILEQYHNRHAATTMTSRLNSSFLDFLTGAGQTSYIDQFCKRDRDKTICIDKFPVAPQSVDIIRSLLKSRKPCNILLYGAPGTGKTEFARSIIADSGKECYFVTSDIHNNSIDCKKLAIITSVLVIAENGGVLVIDEADDFLNTEYSMFCRDGRPDKGWLNNFLEQSRARVIWITNETRSIVDSTMRRFAYSLPFNRFTQKERLSVWDELLRGDPLRRYLSRKIVDELSAEYKVNAAGIAASLDTAKKIITPGNRSAKTIKNTIKELLKRHAQATGTDQDSRLNKLANQYDIALLNIDTEAENIVQSLNAYCAYRKDHGQLADGNLNLLFWGQPGTGKTEFAKYLASETKMGLMVRRSSDLLGCYVGQTEANIKQAFEEAQKDESILFIDEADSFFIDRTHATRSWETSQTNEMLTQMENFKGVLICCTNMLDQLDSAVMRRFPWKVKFMELKPESRSDLFPKFFRIRKKMTAEHRRQLRAIRGLTIGDYKAVHERFRFIPATQLKYQTLISALEDEVNYRDNGSQPIGFKPE